MQSDDVKKGFVRAPNRALIRSLGITDEEMDRPFIGIANAYNNIVPGHIHLRSITNKVIEGVVAAGGVPFEFGVIGICDGIAMGHEGMRYSLPSRENVADSIELMVGAHRFDGLVCVGTCDKIVPGMLMAAMRTDLPTAIVTGGAMLPGYLDECELSLIDVFEAVGKCAAGKITEKELHTIECAAMPGCGSCQGLYTANTMACMTEALGFSLPGCAAIPAVDSAKLRIARKTGERIISLVNEGLSPRKIGTLNSFRNAIRLDMALGGSTNTVLHLIAIAHEGNVPLSLSSFDEIAAQVPHLCAMQPSGPHSMLALYRSGGIPAVLNSLLPHLEDARTISGQTILEIAKAATQTKGSIVQPLSSPVSSAGGLRILYGNLAPDGAVIKSAAVPRDRWEFEGSARVFEGELPATEAILSGKIKEGDVVVIRYEGPVGGPSLPRGRL